MDGHQSAAPSLRRATSYDVAHRAGVSQSAVSRCFRDGASISSTTRQKVEEAARALGYAPNKIARSLITQRSRIIAVLVSEATANTNPMLLPRLGLEIQAAQHRMLAFVMPGNDAAPALPDILAYHTDAVVSAVVVPDAMMQVCAASHIPVVTYNRRSGHSWASAVGCNDAAALERLVAHLHAGGCRRIHLLAGPPDATVSISRMQAAAAAAAAHGMEVVGQSHADYTYEGGYAAAAGAMAERPDAVVCANDTMALGLMDACRYGMGLRVPDDVAITGFDDVPESVRPPYRLTTLAQPVSLLARTALRIAQERLDGTAEPGEQRLMPIRLVVRGSTRPVP